MWKRIKRRWKMYQFRKAYILYAEALDRLDCGLFIARQISYDFNRLEARVNRLAEELGIELTGD